MHFIVIILIFSLLSSLLLKLLLVIHADRLHGVHAFAGLLLLLLHLQNLQILLVSDRFQPCKSHPSEISSRLWRSDS